MKNFIEHLDFIWQCQRCEFAISYEGDAITIKDEKGNEITTFFGDIDSFERMSRFMDGYACGRDGKISEAWFE